MALSPGTKLGPYEVVAPIGAGGMGEVYRAKDTRLDRSVAIKILPAQFSSDPVRKQRFEREAKTISSLNHPHICVLHDIGHQDGIDYLVMECVEGETLAKRLEKGALPLEQVLKYGAQIADALDKAHRLGVVHRDLKPGNIVLASTGAKLLDFGLAKPGSPLASAVTLTAATPAAAMTEEGMVVGTFQYMSPEQVEGKEVDGRSDIFSLGAVLYEMLTGKHAFEGKSQLSIASAILEREPEPISATKPLTPPPLEHAIRKCLTKDPDERWQSSSDLASELKWIATSASQIALPASATTRRGQWVRAGWVAALLCGVAAVLFAVAYFHKEPLDRRVVRSLILPPEGGAFVLNGPIGGGFLSPDGRSLAFIARVGKITQLWIRPLESFAARPLPGTEDASFAFWSPDSRNLGFFAQGKLKRIAISGGPPQSLCDVDSNRGASWGRSNVIIFSRVSGEIQRIPASGGSPQRVTTLDVNRREGTHRWPYFLPDGNHFLFMAALLGPFSEDNVFYVGSLDGKPARMLFHGSSPIIYSMGHVLYLAESVLMAKPFDVEKLDSTGEAVPIAEGVEFDPMFSNGVFSASENGILLYQLAKGGNSRSLTIFDRTGKQVARLGEAAPNSAIRLSPDSKNLLYDVTSPATGRVDLWLANILSGSRTRVASDAFNLGSHSPVWSPDGERLAYVSMKANDRAIYVKEAHQMAAAEERWEAKADQFVSISDWTPDGKFLVLTEHPFGSGSDHLSLLQVTGRVGAEPLLQMQGANVVSGHVSPDGRWIAYCSDVSGRDEIYISSFPKPTGTLQVSTTGGVSQRWRHDGKELYYLAPDKMLMAAEVKSLGGSLQITSARPLFEMFPTMFLTIAGVNQYDVTGDGSRFVADSVVSDESPAPLNLVTNWTEELRNK